MIGRIYCPSRGYECDTPSTCQQHCPLFKNYPTLTTGNGGNVITKGEPLPARPKTFQPDYGVTRAQYKTSLTPLGYVLAIGAVLMFVVYVYRNA